MLHILVTFNDRRWGGRRGRSRSSGSRWLRQTGSSSGCPCWRGGVKNKLSRVRVHTLNLPKNEQRQTHRLENVSDTQVELDSPLADDLVGLEIGGNHCTYNTYYCSILGFNLLHNNCVQTGSCTLSRTQLWNSSFCWLRKATDHESPSPFNAVGWKQTHKVGLGPMLCLPRNLPNSGNLLRAIPL